MIDASSRVAAQPLATQPVKLPGAREGEITLFHSEGVLVTSERLVAEGRTWRLGEVERVDAIHRAPRTFPFLFTSLVGMVLGLPLLLAALAAASAEGKWRYEAALALAGTGVFASIAGLLVIGDTYWLVLRTRQSERRVFRSRDHRVVSNLVSVVSAAAEAARQRP